MSDSLHTTIGYASLFQRYTPQLDGEEIVYDLQRYQQAVKHISKAEMENESSVAVGKT